MPFWSLLTTTQKVMAGVVVSFLSLLGFNSCRQIVDQPCVYGGPPEAYQKRDSIPNPVTLPEDSVVTVEKDSTNE